MSRRALALSLLLLAASCAPRHGPPPLPGGRAPFDAFLARRARLCGEVGSYRASGTLAITSGDFRVQADETVLFRSPDELRVGIHYGGFLWIGQVRGDLLLRGDSVYVAVSPGLPGWRGTTTEFLADWTSRARLALALARALSPAGPPGCEPDSLRPTLLEERREEARGVVERDGLSWDLLVDTATGFTKRCGVSRPGGKTAVTAAFEEPEAAGGQEPGIPARIGVRSLEEGLELEVRQVEVSVNPGLADSVFEPGAGE